MQKLNRSKFPMKLVTMEKRKHFAMDGMNFFAALMAATSPGHQFRNESDIDRALSVTPFLIETMVPKKSDVKIVMKQLPDSKMWYDFTNRFHHHFLDNDRTHCSYSLIVPRPSYSQHWECDDEVTVQLATESNGYIISNDRYQWLEEKKFLTNGYVQIDKSGVHHCHTDTMVEDMDRARFIRFCFDQSDGILKIIWSQDLSSALKPF